MSFNYLLHDYFSEGDAPIKRGFKKKLLFGSQFTINDVTYLVEHVEHYEVDDCDGKALIRMVRYKIPDTSTQFVHKCPVKKDAMEKLDRDDIVKLEQKLGKKRAAKRIEAWKTGRTKMQSYNKLEKKCPLCECIFWKENNLVPETVIVDGVMHKQRLRK